MPPAMLPLVPRVLEPVVDRYLDSGVGSSAGDQGFAGSIASEPAFALFVRAFCRYRLRPDADRRADSAGKGVFFYRP